MKSALLKKRNKIVLITGGAGFVGTNLANHFLSRGYRIRIFDNLSRKGVDQNLQWILDRGGDQVEFLPGDVRDFHDIREAVSGVDLIYHLAAQVAVTSSLLGPVEDFEINTRGTLNVLEAIRGQVQSPPLIYTSTNKVYGGLHDLILREKTTRYFAPNSRYRSISENRQLDFHSPYGCSKGAADQYVRDYARSFGLRTIVFRMSCIYGPHQFGNEDQGWVAHFLIRASQGEPITIYGDGKQVRDILFVEDLVEACYLAYQNIDRLAGSVFNMGGGAHNTISLLELLKVIRDITGSTLKTSFANAREGDQRYYVSDTSAFTSRTGWSAKVGIGQGINKLYAWIVKNRAAQSEPSLVRAAA
ncbi:MAG: NAD-dependent epimerase/dehydratase family protein [Verrucomicrobia bacterium]|nr:NAD-dependent epimerase/dehydratase family protein [Verrucomicrobiota bacterium]